MIDQGERFAHRSIQSTPTSCVCFGILDHRVAFVGAGMVRGTPGMAGTDNQASADTTGFRPRRVTSLLSPSAAAMNSLAHGHGSTPSGHSIALKRSVNAKRPAFVS
jgi:hypothetical protein